MKDRLSKEEEWDESHALDLVLNDMLDSLLDDFEELETTNKNKTMRTFTIEYINENLEEAVTTVQAVTPGEAVRLASKEVTLSEIIRMTSKLN